MRHRSLLISIVALLALAVSATAAIAASPRAVVYSKSTTLGGEVKGGLFAVKSGHLNQITENPADTEPAFSADGRTIAFVRAGDLYSVRPDGSGQRQLTSGSTLDSAPIVSPDGKRVVFERRASEDGAADLYSVRVLGGGLHGLTSGPVAGVARLEGTTTTGRTSRQTDGRSSSSATPIPVPTRPRTSTRCARPGRASSA